MKWMFEDFKADLKDLNPRVREKALEIADQLMKKENFSEKKAVTEAIKQAEEWFYNSEG